MTKNNHPITPPPELVEQWRNLPEYVSQLRTMSTVTITTEKLQHIATQAARWGSDQELKACYEWVVRDWTDIQSADMLLAARRPKPPSLKEQALSEVAGAVAGGNITPERGAIIRLALEALPND